MFNTPSRSFTVALALVLLAALLACTLASPEANPFPLLGQWLVPDTGAALTLAATAAAAAKPAKAEPATAAAGPAAEAPVETPPAVTFTPTAAAPTPPAMVAQLEAADAAADAAMNAAAVAEAAADRAQAIADALVTAAAAEPKPMTLDEAAALVKRRTVVTAEGAQPRVVEQRIHPEEVLSFKDHGTHVVVVTADGQKFSTADAA